MPLNAPRFYVLLLSLCLTGMSYSQTLSSRLVDAKTQEPIPYATVQYDENRGLITNEEGRFSLVVDELLNKPDSLIISCMGYERTALATNQPLDSAIAIKPRAIELSGVYLFDHELTVEEIIDKVEERLPVNYNNDPIRQRVFFRQSSLNRLRKFDVEFKKSTIAELNEPFIDSVISIMPRGSDYYTETLGDFYKSNEETLLHIDKAAELYDKNNEGSMEALAEKMEKIFKDNVKPDSYLKIKSGIFGTKVQVDSILEAEEEAAEIEGELKEPEKNHFLSYKRGQIKGLFSGLFFQEDSKLNFIRKSGRYNFSLKGYTTIDDQGVYVIDFEPKRSADFKGTAFVNIEDFAVMRLDYSNVKSLRRIRLLGFSYEETVYRGTTIFAKGNNDKYDVRFIEKVEGRVMGVDRPLKVIEKNKYVKGRRKQNELSLGIDLINRNTEKYELVVFDSEAVSNAELSKVIENETIEATYLSKYSPEFWEGYNIMEPNQAIREFKVSEEAK